jgi:hypothetical protein
MRSRQSTTPKQKTSAPRSSRGIRKKRPGSKAVARQLENDVKEGRLFGPFRSASELLDDLEAAKRIARKRH